MSGPLPDLLRPLTVPASWIYARAIARRNRRYDEPQAVRRVDRPVVSVGNITTGGVGKTPMVAWIVEALQRAGCAPVIAMRGYGAAPGMPSDEEAEYADRLPGVPVVADPRRWGALRSFLPGHPEVDCVVLDDGFQHRQLHRDLDLVLVDARAGTFADRLLPAGHLREPLENLRRADAIVVTHADGRDQGIEEAIRRWSGGPPLAWTAHHWEALQVLAPSGEVTDVPVGWLQGKRLATLLGVARPVRVRDHLERVGATLAVDIAARDHEQFDRAKIAAARPLCEGVDALVLTGKDWVKARHLIDLPRWPVPVVIPRLRLRFVEGEAALVDLIVSSVRRAPACPEPADEP
jgi:tetraacyldisaccharide 4'-kinase